MENCRKREWLPGMVMITDRLRESESCVIRPKSASNCHRKYHTPPISRPKRTPTTVSTPAVEHAPTASAVPPRPSSGLGVDSMATARVPHNADSADPQHWSVEGVARWLASNGFDKDVCDSFKKQGIKGSHLPAIQPDHFSRLGISTLGDEISFKNALGALFADDLGSLDQHRAKRARLSGSTSLAEAETTGKQISVSRTADVLDYWRRKASSLPTAEDLTWYLETHLPEHAKIPIDQSRLETLISSPNQTRDCVRRQDLEILFRITAEENADVLGAVFSALILYETPDDNGTESSFHWFWDVNFSNIMKLILPRGTSIRDSNHNTSTASCSPDFGFLYLGSCVFRGEEKAATNKEDPRAELRDKMTWTYDPAPYVFGYYATGALVTVVAICRPSQPSEKPRIVDIIQVDLREKAERIKNVVRMINLCSLIELLSTTIKSGTLPEFIPICKDDKIIEICGTNVRKTYHGPDCILQLQRLKQVYERLRFKSVPNVDDLQSSYLQEDKGNRKAIAVAYFQPKGLSVSPETIEEVFDAISCILEALVMMHKEPDPIFHRDIRWPNVIRRADEPSKWFLIDWEDAASPPTSPAIRLDLASHSPAVYQPNHGSEVDVWAVGKLIQDISKQRVRCLPRGFLQLADAMKAGVTAAQSLEMLGVLRGSRRE